MNDLVPPAGSQTLDDEPAANSTESTEPADAAEGQQPVLNEQQAMMLMESLQSEQNLLFGSLTGFFAALVGAGVWALITVVTEYQIGFMAIGIGFLVGFAVQFAGKGVSQVFGIVGAVLSLLGCAVGNLLTVSWFVADSEGMALMEVLMQLNPTIAFDLLASMFEIIDVLFYGLAAYFGYKYAFRQITQADIDRAMGKGF